MVLGFLVSSLMWRLQSLYASKKHFSSLQERLIRMEEHTVSQAFVEEVKVKLAVLQTEVSNLANTLKSLNQNIESLKKR